MLSDTFPPGQTLAAGDEGFFPTALGHEYWCSVTAPYVVEQMRNAGAGHSDYWGWKRKKPQCEKTANEQARTVLGLTGFGDRNTAQSSSYVRDGGEGRTLPVRDIMPRNIVSRVVG